MGPHVESAAEQIQRKCVSLPLQEVLAARSDLVTTLVVTCCPAGWRSEVVNAYIHRIGVEEINCRYGDANGCRLECAISELVHPFLP